jgi:hypothetical protein
VISLVIRLARLAPDGAIAPTERGLQARARKNNKTSCAAIGVSHPFQQTASTADAGMDAICRMDVVRTLRVSAGGEKLLNAAAIKTGDDIYEVR